MLLESIVRAGSPIAQSSMSHVQRIRYLTDIESDTAKNFFRHVFVIELNDEGEAFHFFNFHSENHGKTVVDQEKASSFPIILPSGGNRTNAQGIYPIPCYPLYDKNISSLTDQSEVKKMIKSRLDRTLSYRHLDENDRKKISERVARILQKEASLYVTKEKQFGILMIADLSLNVFSVQDSVNDLESFLYVCESKVIKNPVLLDAKKVSRGLVESRVQEAKELGEAKGKTSTLSEERSEETVSAYNKGWLWLSPTWEMPKSIYWGPKDWTKGIRLNRSEYEGFLYGTQLMKKTQVPLSSTLLKELFAPVTSMEAKQNMNPTNFDTVFGIPLLVPVLDGEAEDMRKYYEVMSQRARLKAENEQASVSDIQLEFIAGLENIVLPRVSDDYRLMILYYSGELSRGNIHIRAVMEDVLPSILSSLQQLLKNLRDDDLPGIRRAFGLDPHNKPDRRLLYLPALLSNAYGTGYLWSSLQSVLDRKEITVDRIRTYTSMKLNELANKNEFGLMRYELVFYHGFLAFYKAYCQEIVKNGKGERTMGEWMDLAKRYQAGTCTDEDYGSPETIGFISGLALKQFSQSYYTKTGRSFVEHRVMRFGSKLTPEMIWKQGLLRCEELSAQWDLRIKQNFREALARLLTSMLDAKNERWLTRYKDEFMTTFWSGYLMYQNVKEERDGDDQQQ